MGVKRDERVELGPGPGEYELKDKKEGGFTIGERLADKEIEDAPAPGQYELKSTLVEGPQYSMYERRAEKLETTVGPGEYELPE